MTDPRGTRFETAVVEYLKVHGYPDAERRAKSGRRDKGDLAGVPTWACELKDRGRIDLAGWTAEAQREAGNAGADWWAVIAKRRGKNVAAAYVVMDLEQWCRLIGGL